MATKSETRNEEGPRPPGTGNAGRKTNTGTDCSTSEGLMQAGGGGDGGTRVFGVGSEGAKLPPYRSSVLGKAKAVYRKWLKLPDDRVIDFMFGVFFANRLGGDPVWGGLVGASGDTKTELLRSLRHPEIMTLSNLTGNTLISGLPSRMTGGNEPSLLPKLHEKVLVVKDLTPLITGRWETMSQILGQLRDAYDGSSSMAFGTGEIKEFKSRFGFLFGVTPVIESCWSVINQLGERFIYYRCPDGDSLAKVGMALENSNKKDVMREELASAAARVLSQDVPEEVDVPDDLTQQIMYLADVVATARTPVKRAGGSQEVTYFPSAEVGTRLAGQFIQLARGIAIARGQSMCDESMMEIVRRVARSGIPNARLRLIEHLVSVNMTIPTAEVGQRLRLGSGTIRRNLEDLWTLGLVERVADGTSYSWYLSDGTRKRLNAAKLLGAERSVLPPEKRTLTHGPETGGTEEGGEVDPMRKEETLMAADAVDSRS